MTTPAPSSRGACDRYRARVEPDLNVFLDLCQQFEQPCSLPFHTATWLGAWYATLGQADGRQPLRVIVTAAASGQVVALLPLAARRRWGLRLVEFADAGVTDYVAPIVAPEWHGGLPPIEAARALWTAVRAALQGQDLFHVDKLLGPPLDPPGQADNPLVLALPVRDSRFFGSAFTALDGWEAWRRSLDKTVRKEIERCWRVFQRDEQACFALITDPSEAREMLAHLERQQSTRMQALGKPYHLDQPAFREFYRRLLDEGLGSGQTVISALRSHHEVVAVLFGVSNAQRFIALRQGMSPEPAWRAISPGRLLHEATARVLLTGGRTCADFGIGEYHHKAIFKPGRIPLYEACVALTWRGALARSVWQLKRANQSRHDRQVAAAKAAFVSPRG